MKPLQIRINTLSSPGLSSFIVLGRAVKGMNYSEKVIRQYFNKCVEKNDFVQNDKNALLEHLYRLTSTGNIRHKVGNDTRFARPIVKTPSHESYINNSKFAPKIRKSLVLGR